MSGWEPLTRALQIRSPMVEDPSAPRVPKPNKPTSVREPDNSRPPGEPVPRKPMQPQETGGT
jgi:hypothetical protein